MTPSWYDVLGVEEDATAAEIRAAWQESVAGLDPTAVGAEVNRDVVHADVAHDREAAAANQDLGIVREASPPTVCVADRHGRDDCW